MAFENLLDPIFNPLLKMHPALAILLISFLITLLITLVYKYTTDQKKMKRIKAEMKENQKKLKELSKTDPENFSPACTTLWPTADISDTSLITPYSGWSKASIANLIPIL